MQLTWNDIAAIRGFLLSGADPELIHLKTGYDTKSIIIIKKELKNTNEG